VQQSTTPTSKARTKHLRENLNCDRCNINKHRTFLAVLMRSGVRKINLAFVRDITSYSPNDLIVCLFFIAIIMKFIDLSINCSSHYQVRYPDANKAYHSRINQLKPVLNADKRYT